MFAPRILAGRSLVVTGGGSGLGLAMAKCFAGYGARVTIAGRRRERLEAAAPEIEAAARSGADAGQGAGANAGRSEPGAVAICPTDVRDAGQAESLIAFAAERFGGQPQRIRICGGPLHGQV